jgi:hypothetical protein
MDTGTFHSLSFKRGPADRSCICCGNIFPSREPSHRVCQACRPQHTLLRLFTHCDPWLMHPDRGHHVESCPTAG